MLSLQKPEANEPVLISPDLQKKIEAAVIQPEDSNKKSTASLNRTILLTGGDKKVRLSAAYMISKKTGNDLYRIDLSAVVSKYIGETEKNLSTVFKKAEGKDWILFFDEADALFGKRTDVRDSHDRYANIEVSYLLEKIESYTGIIILSSNQRQSIDNAFIRRIRTLIEI